MTIENQTVVSVSYRLSVQNEDQKEELVEQTESSNPFVFLFGVGGVLEDFESNLRGKAIGDAFDFIIEAEKGYGKYDESYIVNVPLTAFKNEKGEIDSEMVQVGNTLPMVDQEGNRIQGTIKEVGDEAVQMDFNHPLAGQNLHFQGEVVAIREASKEELEHGHVHGEGGHHH